MSQPAPFSKRLSVAGTIGASFAVSVVPYAALGEALSGTGTMAPGTRLDTGSGTLTVDLRDGTTPNKKSNPKPVIVSMGSLAASGGYYIAAPAQTIT